MQPACRCDLLNLLMRVIASFCCYAVMVSVCACVVTVTFATTAAAAAAATNLTPSQLKCLHRARAGIAHRMLELRRCGPLESSTCCVLGTREHDYAIPTAYSVHSIQSMTKYSRSVTMRESVRGMPACRHRSSHLEYATDAVAHHRKLAARSALTIPTFVIASVSAYARVQTV